MMTGDLVDFVYERQGDRRLHRCCARGVSEDRCRFRTREDQRRFVDLTAHAERHPKKQRIPRGPFPAPTGPCPVRTKRVYIGFQITQRKRRIIGLVHSELLPEEFSMIATSLFQSKVCRFMIWDRRSLMAFPVSDSFLRS